MNTYQCQRNDPKSLGFCTIFVVFAKVLVIAVYCKFMSFGGLEVTFLGQNFFSELVASYGIK